MNETEIFKRLEEAEKRLESIEELLQTLNLKNPRKNHYGTQEDGYRIRGFLDAAIFVGMPTADFKVLVFKNVFRSENKGRQWYFNSLELLEDHKTYLTTL